MAYGLAAVALIALGVVGEALLNGRQNVNHVASVTPSPAPASLSPSGTADVIRGRIAMWSGQPGSGGFVTFPGGQFKLDSASNVGYPTDSPGTATSAQGLSYDPERKSWVLVPRRLIRPDGQGYVFNKIIGGYFVITVVRADGTSYNLPQFPWNGSYDGYTLLGAEPEGIYYSDVSRHLWEIDYLGSSIREVSGQSLNWLAATHGYGYGISRQGGVNPLIRIDLRTGAGGPWFHRAGLVARLIGFTDAGTPIVAADSRARTEIWLEGSSPLMLKAVDAAPDAGLSGVPLNATSASGTDDAVWVATNRGLYLYTAKGGWVFAATGGGDVVSPLMPNQMTTGRPG